MVYWARSTVLAALLALGVLQIGPLYSSRLRLQTRTRTSEAASTNTESRVKEQMFSADGNNEVMLSTDKIKLLNNESDTNSNIAGCSDHAGADEDCLAMWGTKCCPSGYRCRSTPDKDCDVMSDHTCKCFQVLSNPTQAYESASATQKLSALWAEITKDPSSDQFMDPLDTVSTAWDKSYLWKMQNTHADWREINHHKISHGIGAVAAAHFSWESNEYSGMFQKADHCLIRMANAAAPGGLTMQSYGPNMGVKCFRDGVESANMQFIWQIDGYQNIPTGKQKSCSYFEAPLSNHNPLRDDIPATLKEGFIPAFNQVDPHSMMLGLSQMAVASQDGSTASPHFPFALVLKPVQGLNSVPCTFDKPISQLENLGAYGWVAGKPLYDVYAVKDPSYQPSKQSVKRIGSLVLDSPFTPSDFADTRLFFRHTFFNQELQVLAQTEKARAEAWLEYVNSDMYKVEGAGLYWPFLS